MHTSEPQNQRRWRWSSALCFNKPSESFWCMLRFENDCKVSAIYYTSHGRKNSGDLSSRPNPQKFFSLFVPRRTEGAQCNNPPRSTEHWDILDRGMNLWNKHWPGVGSLGALPGSQRQVLSGHQCVEEKGWDLGFHQASPPPVQHRQSSQESREGSSPHCPSESVSHKLGTLRTLQWISQRQEAGGLWKEGRGPEPVGCKGVWKAPVCPYWRFFALCWRDDNIWGGEIMEIDLHFSSISGSCITDGLAEAGDLWVRRLSR